MGSRHHTSLDHLDYQRQVCGEVQELLGVKDAVGAKTAQTAQDRGPCKTLFPQELDKRLVERFVVIAITLSDEDPHQYILANQFAHGFLLL